MAASCELTGKRVQSGNNVSHSQIKTKRKFNINSQYKRFYSEILGQDINLRVSAAGIKSVSRYFTIDGFLLKADKKQLSEKAAKVQALLLKKIAGGSAKNPIEAKAIRVNLLKSYIKPKAKSSSL